MNLSTDVPDGVALVVTQEDGVRLVDAYPARREDFVVGADLPGGRATLDLYGHYEVFRSRGARPYSAEDWLCRTYEKFGHVVQDRLMLTVELRPGRAPHSLL